MNSLLQVGLSIESIENRQFVPQSTRADKVRIIEVNQALFEKPSHADELDLIRSSLHSGTPLGNDRFEKKD